MHVLILYASGSLFDSYSTSIICIWFKLRNLPLAHHYLLLIFAKQNVSYFWNSVCFKHKAHLLLFGSTCINWRWQSCSASSKLYGVCGGSVLTTFALLPHGIRMTERSWQQEKWTPPEDEQNAGASTSDGTHFAHLGCEIGSKPLFFFCSGSGQGYIQGSL